MSLRGLAFRLGEPAERLVRYEHGSRNSQFRCFSREACSRNALVVVPLKTEHAKITAAIRELPWARGKEFFQEGRAVVSEPRKRKNARGIDVAEVAILPRRGFHRTGSLLFSAYPEADTGH